MLIKTFLGASIGTMIEYYDMVLYIVFLPIISPILFGGSTSQQSLTNGYLVLFITMLARPIGAIFFGHLGDTKSRPRALLASMYGIAFATIIIGLTPPRTLIGPFAVLIIILAKSVQTFCFGGEFSGAGIYIVEHAHKNQKAFVGSLLSAVAISGSLIASLLGILFTSSFFPPWSWRLTFILGGLAGFIGIFYRKNMLESPHFVRADPKQESLFNLFKKFPLELLAGTLTGGISTIAYTTALVFINPQLVAKGDLSNHSLMIVQSLLIVFSMLVLILAGKITDKITPVRMMKTACILLILSYPLLCYLIQGSTLEIIMASCILILLNELFFAPANAFYSQIFPMSYRYRGASLSFCLGMSFLGGLTPLVETFLYQKNHQLQSIFLWILLNTVLCFASLQILTNKKRSREEKTVLLSTNEP